jgi:hypothetical protein
MQTFIANENIKRNTLIVLKKVKTSVNILQQAFSKMSVQMQSKGITDVSILAAFYNSLGQLSLHTESLKWIITDNEIRGICCIFMLPSIAGRHIRILLFGVVIW